MCVFGDVRDGDEESSEWRPSRGRTAMALEDMPGRKRLLAALPKSGAPFRAGCCASKAKPTRLLQLLDDGRGEGRACSPPSRSMQVTIASWQR